MNQHTPLGWYGKLPSAGDFLQRRLPDALINHWSRWFQMGLMHWQHSEEPTPSPRQFDRAPVWNFVIPATLGSQRIQMGCLLPASDRVGRHYPICALHLFTLDEWHPQQLACAGAWYQQLGRTLHQGVRQGYSVEQLDLALLALPPLPSPASDPHADILAVIGHQKTPSTLNWQQVADSFEPTQYTSFWWTNQSDGHPLYTHIHSGNFTSQLFSLLFAPAGGAQPGRNGLYPPMFD